MAQKIIDRGTKNNNTTGDSLWTGAGKINDNFTELYASGGIDEAPIDGNQYARQDGAWSTVAAGGGGGGFQQVWEWNGLVNAFNNGTKYYYSWDSSRGSGRNVDMATSFIASNEALMAADYQTGAWGQVLYDQTINKFHFTIGRIIGTAPATYSLKMFKCTYSGVTQNSRVKIVDTTIGTLMTHREQAEVLDTAFTNTTLTKGDWVYCYIATDTLNSGNLANTSFYLETTAT